MAIRSLAERRTAEVRADLPGQFGCPGRSARRHALRVLLGTDQRLFADALECALTERGVIVAGRALHPANLVATAVTQLPSICLISARWLAGDGARVLSALHPAIKVVALAATTADVQLTAAARQAGVVAVLSQHQQVAELIETLYRVRAGERPVAAVPATTVVRAMYRPAPPPATSVLDRLTLREQEVLMLIADGRATTEIARALAITLHTARTHVQSVLVKLGAHSRLEASGMAARSGLLGPADRLTATHAGAR